MKALLLAAAFATFASPARAGADWRASDRAVFGSSRYAADDLEAGVLLPSARWDVSARAKSFRSLDAFPGAETEYSARLERNLPHVSVAGRLGSAPPNSQRLGYHLAAGEVTITFYGLTIGPKDAARIATVAEDSATLAELSHLDATWVTRARAVYTNADFHLQARSAAEHDFIIVQNTWQFFLSETWRDRTSVVLSAGESRYSTTVHPFLPEFAHWNVDYPGAPFALSGYPNNDIGVEFSQRLSSAWALRAGVTRLNMLFGGIQVLGGSELSWRAGATGFEARAGWYHHHVMGVSTREAWTAGASYRW